MSYTVDEKWLRDAARAYVWVAIRYSAFVWLLPAIVVVGVVIGLLGRDPGLMVAVLLAFVVVFPVIIYLGARRALSRQLPPGSRVDVTFTDTTLDVTTPLTTASMSYALFSRAVRLGRFVLLRQKSTGWTVMDGSVATDADLHRFS